MPKIPETRKCLNPGCPDYFETTDDRKFYCHKKCKNQASNAKQKELNNTLYIRDKEIRSNSKKIQKLHDDPRYSKEVPEIIIKHERINTLLHTDKGLNKDTDRPILWSHLYGLEIIETTPYKLYKIHKREK